MKGEAVPCEASVLWMLAWFPALKVRLIEALR
jgi:hypothetical protein